MNNEGSWWGLFLPQKAIILERMMVVHVCMLWRKKLSYQVLVSELIWLKNWQQQHHLWHQPNSKVFLAKPSPMNLLFSPAASQHSYCLLTGDFSGGGRLLLLLFLQLLLQLVGGGWRGISYLTHSDGVARSTSGPFRCPPFIAFVCYFPGILLLHLQRTIFF